MRDFKNIGSNFLLIINTNKKYKLIFSRYEKKAQLEKFKQDSQEILVNFENYQNLTALKPKTELPLYLKLQQDQKIENLKQYRTIFDFCLENMMNSLFYFKIQVTFGNQTIGAIIYDSEQDSEFSGYLSDQKIDLSVQFINPNLSNNEINQENCLNLTLYKHKYSNSTKSVLKISLFEQQQYQQFDFPNQNYYLQILKQMCQFVPIKELFFYQNMQINKKINYNPGQFQLLYNLVKEIISTQNEIQEEKINTFKQEKTYSNLQKNDIKYESGLKYLQKFVHLFYLNEKNNNPNKNLLQLGQSKVLDIQVRISFLQAFQKKSYSKIFRKEVIWDCLQLCK
ncbi:hypothetical protein PPERSA_04575 [Pseudocohnilembus persalinus]|uniref:Uncharacterized protein n=1 Tax=Pseudocohnilembus persalinus TaxID=266149 RepID=A0A0V0QEC3_PSEPJ|nr:hypothetical protein PPERSA_04575 [Pseudocohnilembus persalinus]|eukprot:KRX00554.1 hypothetical protein PPERSA_04575 [Pseudocohnilembus persalinus]